MGFLENLQPNKKVIYKTSLSPQKVAQRLESKITSKPKRKSIFDLTPLSFHGKINENSFEFGRRSRGGKDHPSFAKGTIEENEGGSIVRAIIEPNFQFAGVFILLSLLIVFVSIPTIFFMFSGEYEAAAYTLIFPVFFMLGGSANYLVYIRNNNKLAKKIGNFIEGKIIK